MLTIFIGTLVLLYGGRAIGRIVTAHAEETVNKKFNLGGK